MSCGLFKMLPTNYFFINHIYLIYIYKEDLALYNLQTPNKPQPTNQPTIYVCLYVYVHFSTPQHERDVTPSQFFKWSFTGFNIDQVMLHITITTEFLGSETKLCDQYIYIYKIYSMPYYLSITGGRIYCIAIAIIIIITTVHIHMQKHRQTLLFRYERFY